MPQLPCCVVAIVVEDGRCVDDDVEPAEVVNRSCHEPIKKAVVGHIPDQVAPVIADDLFDLVSGRLVAVAEYDLGSLPDEPACDCQADQRRAARDHGHLARQLCHDPRPLSFNRGPETGNPASPA